jgi:hypothetical protein
VFCVCRVFSLTCAKLAPIVVLPKGEYKGEGSKTMTEQIPKRGTTAWFLTEQACCLAQAGHRESDDFRACLNAAKYLAGGETDALTVRADIAMCDPDADYDTEDYQGKDRDLAGAIYTLLARGHDAGTPEQARTALLRSADLIAAFYGADLELTA